MSRVVHFELPTSNVQVSKKFFEEVFGWKIELWNGPVEYWTVTTGDPAEPGINGGLGGAANEFHGTVNTVEVSNLDETIEKVLAGGGQVVMPKDEIPGVGWLAYIREPGGAVLGIIQNIPGARM